MILAFIVFALGKPFYAVEKIERKKKLSPEEKHARWDLLGRLAGLFLVVTIFWSIFDQSVTTWTLFARDYLHLKLFGLPLSPDQLQAVNPLLIVLLLPPVTLFWHFLADRGMQLRPTSKMLIGFILTMTTMAIVAISGFCGSSAVVQGGPEALAAAEKTAKTAFESQPGKYFFAANALLAEQLSERSVKLAEGKSTTPEQWQALSAAVRECNDSFDGLAKMSDLDPSTLWTKDAADSLRHAREIMAESKRDAKSLREAADAIAKNAKVVLEKNDAAATALAAAALAANATVHGARAALTAGQAEGDAKTAADAVSKAKLEVETAAMLAEAASNAVKSAVKTATMPKTEQSVRAEINTRIDISACSDAANRAISSAAAARKSIESLQYGNRQVVLQHAAIAALAAADTAVFAARTTSILAQDKEVPEYILQTESAAAAGRISLWWQLIPYLLITISEICISVVGLELAFAVAPASMKSFVTACWLLTVFLADMLNAQITPFYDQYVSWFGITLTPGIFFGIFAALMIPVTLAFIVVSKRFNSLTNS
jgi:hypothetical protein